MAPDATRFSTFAPAPYRVTFTLPGFRTIVREGVELAGTRDHHHQRRHDGRWRAGNHYGQRRDADRRSAVDDPAGRHGPGDRDGDSQLSNALHRGRADPGRTQGRVHGSGRGRLCRPGSGLARSQRWSNLRPAHDGQRRRAQFGDRRRMGRWRGSERDRDIRIRHRRLGRRCPGRDRRGPDQLHPAGWRQPLQRHGLRQLRDGDWAADNFTGTDVQQARTGGPWHDQGERRLQSRLWRTDQARQALVLPVRALSSSPTTTSRARSSTRTRTSWTVSTTCDRRTRRSSTRSRPSTRPA